MAPQDQYSINLNQLFEHLELIDVPGLIAECRDDWYNQTLCRVNECVVRLGGMQGEFHWHHHDNEDEFFFLLLGEFLIDYDDVTVALKPHQGFTVPKGVRHRTRAPVRSAVIMIEGSTVMPTGDGDQS